MRSALTGVTWLPPDTGERIILSIVAYGRRAVVRRVRE